MVNEFAAPSRISLATNYPGIGQSQPIDSDTIG